jgi:drug/metabolite transporter (DMT)-like permease
VTPETKEHEMNVSLLSFIMILLVTGQFLFKQAGWAIRGRSLLDACLAILSLPVFYLAVSIYALATLLWVYVLSRVPLTLAYPWIACTTIAVPLIGRFVYAEQVTPFFWLGIGFVVVGFICTQIGGAR